MDIKLNLETALLECRLNFISLIGPKKADWSLTIFSSIRLIPNFLYVPASPNTINAAQPFGFCILNTKSVVTRERVDLWKKTTSFTLGTPCSCNISISF